MKAAMGVLVVVLVTALARVAAAPAHQADRSCFLLYEIGGVGAGEARRAPAEACQTRVAPQSTFKIPHALAALDAGVIQDAQSSFAYDGTEYPFASWKRDHTLATAMRDSVVWWFQRVARELGAAREREYLQRLAYGNGDSSSGLTTFWLGGSLAISPEEQAQFLSRLFANALPVSDHAMRTVRAVLVQPHGKVVNAAGAHAFGGAWPQGTVLSAKTGSGNINGGGQVRWLVGHVARGARAWVFVSCVIGSDETPALAAIDLAAQSLRREGVLNP